MSYHADWSWRPKASDKPKKPKVMAKPVTSTKKRKVRKSRHQVIVNRFKDVEPIYSIEETMELRLANKAKQYI